MSLRERLNGLAQRPRRALDEATVRRRQLLRQLGARLAAARAAAVRAETARIAGARDTVGRLGARLKPAAAGEIARKALRLAKEAQLLESLNYKTVLARGYAVVRDAVGDPVVSAAAVAPAQALAIEFADGLVRTTADGPRPKRRPVLGPTQGWLFDG
jgi:exodeoxyribonuclease VII large subunit